jgi:hypothetical protein
MPSASVLPGLAEGSSMVVKMPPFRRKPYAGGVVICSDDLAQVIYCLCAGDTPCAQGFINRREDAAAQEKAVRGAGIGVITDDLACIIDALALGVLCGQGILDRGEDIDWHVVAPNRVRSSSALPPGYPRSSHHPRRPYLRGRCF